MKIHEIEGIIVSRSLLADYGYDPDSVTDEELEKIAAQMIDYWGTSGDYKKALDYAMS